MRILLLSALCLISGAAAAAPHWAFQPLADPAPPPVKDATWAVTEIDRFILAKLEREGLQPAAAADKRTLLRRVTYDLTGLPPTPAEVDAFMADAASDAFQRVVDRLLASPAYGEKWGRFWLDLVHYADTAGENTDRPLVHAWRYRNWVIRAFNADQPYDEFIRWQIAGDLLTAQGPPEQASDKVVATGCLAVARRFGHDVEKEMHLTYEDAIDTMGKTFLGLTLGCARCHDHKYDPVTQRDYYGLYGILQSSRFPVTGCEAKPMPRDMVVIQTPESKAQTAAWNGAMEKAAAAVREAEAALAGQPKAAAVSAAAAISSGEIPAGGAQEFSVAELEMKSGEMLQLAILPRSNHGGDSTGISWEICESGGGARKWNLAGDVVPDAWQDGGGMQHCDGYGNAAVWHFFDLTPDATLFTEFVRDAHDAKGLVCWRNSAPWPAVLINTRGENLAFMTVTMPPRSLALHPGPDGGVAVAWQCPADMKLTVRGKVSKLDAGGDGIAWKLVRRPGLGALLAAQKDLVAKLNAARKSREETAGRKPREDLALALAEAAPVKARLQKKGDPKEPAEEVPRKMLDVLGGGVVPEDAGSGRLQLADWLTRGASRDLTARVMVNRIWQGHFGEAIVGTPNDFGTRGQPPSDPPLLDYLAKKFMDSGWSIKAMHRQILASAAWQRDSAAAPGRSSFPRRRLTAEELRDTLLMLGGSLDRSPGEAHAFPEEKTWTFTQHNPFAAVYDNNRRSIYQMVQRTRRHPFLALFDGADPNASTPVRSQSTVPTQALYFLNDPFVHQQAKAMAGRIVGAAADDARRLDAAARELYGRPAAEDEKAVMTAFLAETSAALPSLSEPQRTIEAWSAWLRVLFGTSELLYVD